MIPYSKQFIDDDDVKAVTDVLKSPFLTQGPNIELFEKNIARYVGAKYAIFVSSGTAALHLSYLSLSLDKDDILVTSPITFVATANAALLACLSVEFSDIDIETGNLDPSLLSKKIQNCTKKPRVIAPVHFTGASCDMEKIKLLADEHSMFVVEDASHAIGGSYLDGGKIGNCKYSDLTVFSFHPVKPITTGEGGLITTNSKNLYKKIIRMRSHGINKLDDAFINLENSHTNNLPNPWYYEMIELGLNYRNTDIHAALGNSQLKKLDLFVRYRKNLANNYDKFFKDVDGVNTISSKNRSFSAHHLYVILIDFTKFKTNRADLMMHLKKNNIGTQVHYIPLFMQPFYQGYKKFNVSDFPNSNLYYDSCISIPMFHGMKIEEQKFVFDCIMNFLNKTS